ncbi:peptidase M28 [Oceanobacillus picturae]|uniref:Peptidase M28 n=1 Tax=Oceanobacillus picturae TaxID=171693 RepID=A0A0U9HBV7_9BACI|nr:peptidase M28 [Oceanobacillus picturae]
MINTSVRTRLENFKIITPFYSPFSIIGLGGDFIMEKKLSGHIAGFGTLTDMERMGKIIMASLLMLARVS